jgi:beta-lactamase regulating signal transducer with metallopeptidase domain
LSKSVSKRSFVGIIGLVFGISVVALFIYSSSYSNMNFEFGGNKISANTHDLTYHSTTQNNSEVNLDDNTSTLLIALWIGLMIVGSYLLFHIHFKVLQKE